MRTVVLTSLLLAVGCSGATEFKPTSVARPVLQRPNHDPATAELAWGPGSRDRAPEPPFRFGEEDLEGASPKFSVTDARGVEWRVKLGPEAQVETAAVRLIWGLGYFAEEAYYLPRVEIDGLPRLKRGREFVSGRTVLAARFEPRRPDVERAGTWDWAHNPFVGTRELDGLRVLMVLLNNYDARQANNLVLLARTSDGRTEARYLVGDIGAALCLVSGAGGDRCKNDLEKYRRSPFLDRVEDGTVRFAYRTAPQGWALPLFVLQPFYAAGELKKQRDMNAVSVESARWIGSRLAQLSDAQLAEAFLSAYDEPTARGFAEAVRARVRQLQGL
jgi:hypothetical protein